MPVTLKNDICIRLATRKIHDQIRSWYQVFNALTTFTMLHCTTEVIQLVLGGRRSSLRTLYPDIDHFATL
jgi:hypothetical protein